MPFRDEYQDIYEYGIILALKHLKLDSWRADENFNNIDIMCKICFEIQKSEYAIINVSDWNPNVLFELGLCYGTNVKTIIIKDRRKSIPSNLQGVEYIEYSNSANLKKNLIKAFEKLISS